MKPKVSTSLTPPANECARDLDKLRFVSFQTLEQEKQRGAHGDTDSKSLSALLCIPNGLLM